MSSLKKPARRQRLPYIWYLGPTFLLVFIGILNFSYLAYTHYQNYTNLTYSSFCALTKSINCDTVSQSSWSVMLGLPVAIWGLVGFFLFLVILFNARKAQESSFSLWSILLTLSLIFSAASMFFGYISSTKIKAYCILCIIGYFLSLSLCFYCWLIRRRFSNASFYRDIQDSLTFIARSPRIFYSVLAIAIFSICLQIFIPSYWQFEPPTATVNISTGLTPEGSPWIGAENPTVVIEEYSDYQCFQCSKMHHMLRNLVSEHPDKIRLVHRHYPMDHEFNSIVVPEPFHVGSGKMAMIAIYATSQDKFWEVNDLLFEIGRAGKPFNLKTIVEKTGLSAQKLALATKHPKIRNHLNYDIRSGMKLEIMGTPTFVVEGKTYTGSIPADILQKVTN